MKGGADDRKMGDVEPITFGALLSNLYKYLTSSKRVA